MTAIQISAHISSETKALMDAYVKMRGVKKAFLVEEALQHYLQAVHEIPEDAIIPTRLVVTKESMTKIYAVMQETAKPTDYLREFFNEKDK